MNFEVYRVDSISGRFQVIEEIGKGTYGVVQKCKDLKTSQVVAIKKILQRSQDGDFPQNTIREVMLLRELRHPNIVELQCVIQSNYPEEDLYLVFEYCEYDLYALLETRALSHDYIKSLMKQFIVALQYCAVRKVIHRDLKPANLFVTRQNILKLGDFGLARKFSEKPNYSDKVITLWYRPPELLLGFKNYGPEVDIWSAGCILYEMVTYKPLFKAKKNEEVSQLLEIFQICGAPQKKWCGFRGQNAKLFDEVKKKIPEKSRLKEHLEEQIPKEYHSLIDLLIQMLNLNPQERITAEDALNHSFIKELGKVVDPLNLKELGIKENHQKSAAEARKKMHLPERPESRPQDRIESLRPQERPQPKAVPL